MKIYRCRRLRFYDGDSATVDLVLDLDFDVEVVLRNRKVRILGIDTPEIKTKNPVEKAAGLLAKQWAAQFCRDKPFVVTFHTNLKRDKYGRLLGDFFLDGDFSLSSHLVRERLAVPYDGGAKADLVDQHTANWKWLQQKGLLAC